MAVQIMTPRQDGESEVAWNTRWREYERAVKKAEQQLLTVRKKLHKRFGSDDDAESDD